jgi:BirA family biotin operon repressor/biotin-[acetyl-CoA-carboxylase] ligase
VASSLARADVVPLLRGRFGRETYVFAERCASTQRLLAEDAAEGAVAVADEQTQGRGRMGRMWVAPAGSSLLLSVRLVPGVQWERLPTVKEPNDVLVAGRKVAGVLAEAVEGRVTLGIGLNVSQKTDELPERPVFPATSLALELGVAPDRQALLLVLLAELERRYDAWRG